MQNCSKLKHIERQVIRLILSHSNSLSGQIAFVTCPEYNRCWPTVSSLTCSHWRPQTHRCQADQSRSSWRNPTWMHNTSQPSILLSYYLLYILYLLAVSWLVRCRFGLGRHHSYWWTTEKGHSPCLLKTHWARWPARWRCGHRWLWLERPWHILPGQRWRDWAPDQHNRQTTEIDYQETRCTFTVMAWSSMNEPKTVASSSPLLIGPQSSCVSNPPVSPVQECPATTQQRNNQSHITKYSNWKGISIHLKSCNNVWKGRVLR